MKACRFCETYITWTRVGVDWRALDAVSGDLHECRSVMRRREEDIRRAAYAAGYSDGLTEGLARASTALSARDLDDLIALAHPDRHPVERGELANRATALLLELRRRVRVAS